MLEKIEAFILDILFELYGVLYKWRISRARAYADGDHKKEARYWSRQADKCVERREDILDKLFRQKAER